MNNELTTARNRKLFIIALIVIILLLIGSFVWQSAQRSGKTGLEINKIPGDTTILINNKKVSGSKVFLVKGTYEIKAEKEGFKPETRKVVVDPAKEPQPKVFFTLTPESDEALVWVEENQDKYLDQEKKAGIYYDNQNNKSLEKNPIIKDLPIRTAIYSIEYSQNNGNFRVQIISSDAMGRQVAIEKIKDLGHDPSDYMIDFKGVDNPFTSAVESQL
jgi:hypothetical protein